MIKLFFKLNEKKFQKGICFGAALPKVPINPPKIILSPRYSLCDIEQDSGKIFESA